MHRPINWHLPEAMHQWLNSRFPGQSDVPAKKAVRWHLGDSDPLELAQEWGTTKTGVYRILLAREYPEVLDIWPQPRYTPAQLAGRRAYTRPTPKTESPNARPLSMLTKLREDLPSLGTRAIDQRLATIQRALGG